MAKEDVKEIENLIFKVLSEQPEAANDNFRYELEIRERIVRVEEELKHQRELLIDGFNRVDKRFEQVEKRFGQMDRRDCPYCSFHGLVVCNNSYSRWASRCGDQIFAVTITAIQPKLLRAPIKI